MKIVGTVYVRSTSLLGCTDAHRQHIYNCLSTDRREKWQRRTPESRMNHVNHIIVYATRPCATTQPTGTALPLHCAATPVSAATHTTAHRSPLIQNLQTGLHRWSLQTPLPSHSPTQQARTSRHLQLTRRTTSPAYRMSKPRSPAPPPRASQGSVNSSQTSAGLTESVFNKALIHIHTPRAILCIACNEAGKLCRDGISNGTPRPNESGTSGKLHAWLHGGEV